MNQDFDLSDLLNEWPYEPGRVNARVVTGPDGIPRIQVRIDLGVLQMEVDGRPDGQRFENQPTLLDAHRQRIRRYIDETGTLAGFVLSSDECRALREEAVQFHYRYMAFFALGDFANVIRDTTHNLELFDLCAEHGETEADRNALQHVRPSLLATRTRAEAELAVQEGRPKDALKAIDHGLNLIRELFREVGAMSAFDDASEVQLLRGMRDALVPKLPASQRVELEQRLRSAIDAENYELAAILRDELRMLKDM